MNFLPKFFCPRPWEGMTGDEAERFCTVCGHAVHNLQDLPMEQKLALLRAPRGDLCGRYRIAIRQAVPGREPAYFEHLLKYGAGVAAASAAFITLWEISADSERRAGHGRFRLATVEAMVSRVMAEELYVETNSMVLGRIGWVTTISAPSTPLAPPLPASIDIHLDRTELEKLLPAPPLPTLPAIELPPVRATK